MIRLPIVAEHGTITGTALVAQLLSEQQSVTAVERFSRWHESSAGNTEYSVRSTECTSRASRQEHARYQSLLPATPPA
ncbi:MAG TPA: hypothetical protein VJ828_05905, partial [Lacipirellulaceae bacterium]|nr:hypothetical protein [Lacipirellulaceae bacterium]